MNAIEAIMTRRSTRKFLEELPQKEIIEKVIESGRYAPSGGNSQTTHFMVFTDRDILLDMAELVQEEFAKIEITENMYRSFKTSVLASIKGGYVFHYHAPVLIVTANQKGYGNAIADSACALENMMIAANALDFGSCWINQLHWLDDNKSVRCFLQQYGLKENETVTGGLALGYADSGLLNRIPLERKGNPVTWIN